MGTAVELPLARRAQLAVVAHIRHIYTNYDRLLKANSFHEARATVEQPTLAKLVEWRGDDENGKTVLEDVFREVIVISDDDDSDVEGEPLPLQGRDASVEAISSNAVVEELQMRPVNHGNPAPWEPQVEHLDDEIASGFRFIPKPPKKTNIDRRGFSRYQAWDRALNRYRNRISGTNHQFPSYSAGEHLPENRGLGREPSSHRTSDAAHLSVARCAFPNQRTVKSNLSRPQINPVAAHRVSAAPSFFSRHPQINPHRGNPGVLTLDEFYELHHLAEPPNKRRGGAIGPPNMPKAFPLERADISEPETYSLQHSDVSSGPVFVSGPREICERIGDDPRHPPWPPGHSHSRKMDEQDHVLPSIESPLPVEIKRPNSGHIEHLTRRMSGAFNFRSVTPHRQVHQGFPKHILPQESFQAHASKRRRVAYHEPIPMENPPAPNGPITLSTHSGDRNSTGEQVSVQNGPQTRRRYVVPVEPPYIGEHALGNAEDSSISTARFDCDPQILAPYGPTKGYDGQPFSYNHHVDSQNGYHISPDQFLTAFDTRYTVTSGSGRDRIIQPRWPDQTESHISRNTQESSCNEGKAPEVTGRRFEYTRGNKDPPLYKPAEKQRLYADGFVRPIDSWEPGMLEYRQAHQLSSGHMVENLPQMANPKLCGAQKRRVTSDILPSALTRPPTHLDPLAKSPFPSQHSAAIGDQVLRHTDKLLRTPPRLSRWKTPKLKSSWYGHTRGPHFRRNLTCPNPCPPLSRPVWHFFTYKVRQQSSNTILFLRKT